MAINKRAVIFGAAVAAAAAAAYWFYGSKQAEEHRRQVKRWMEKARDEIMDAVSVLEDINREQYLRIAEQVAKGYAAAAGGWDSSEMRSFIRSLHDTWQYLQEKRQETEAQRAGGGNHEPQPRAATKKSPRKRRAKKKAKGTE